MAPNCGAVFAQRGSGEACASSASGRHDSGARIRAALREHDKALRSHPMSPVSGNPKGDVTLVEFFDYQCGYCKQSLKPVRDLLETDRQLRVVWKEFPILGPVSRFAARAAMASKKQGRYLEFHVAVMGSRGKLRLQRRRRAQHPRPAVPAGTAGGRAGAKARHRRPRSSLVWTRPGAVRTARAKGRFRAVWRGVCGATSARAAAEPSTR